MHKERTFITTEIVDTMFADREFAQIQRRVIDYQELEKLTSSGVVLISDPNPLEDVDEEAFLGRFCHGSIKVAGTIGYKSKMKLDLGDKLIVVPNPVLPSHDTEEIQKRARQLRYTLYTVVM